MKRILLFTSFLTLLLLGCKDEKVSKEEKRSSNPEVNEICSCLKKTEYYDILNNMDMEKWDDREYQDIIQRKLNNIKPDTKENLAAIKCIAKNIKSLMKHYDKLSEDKEKGKFIRSIMTEMINNECVATFMDRLPFGKLEKELDRNLDGMDTKDFIKFLDKIEDAKGFADLEYEFEKMAKSYEKSRRGGSPEAYYNDTTRSAVPGEYPYPDYPYPDYPAAGADAGAPAPAPEDYYPKY